MWKTRTWRPTFGDGRDRHGLSRNIRRMPVESTWDAAIFGQVCGLPWKLRAGVGRGDALPVPFAGAPTPIAGQVRPPMPAAQLVPFALATPSGAAAAPATPMRQEPEEPDSQGIKRRIAAKSKATGKARSAPLLIADDVPAQGPSSSSAAAATPRPRRADEKSSSSSSDSDDCISVASEHDEPRTPG